MFCYTTVWEKFGNIQAWDKIQNCGCGDNVYCFVSIDTGKNLTIVLGEGTKFKNICYIVIPECCKFSCNKIVTMA